MASCMQNSMPRSSSLSSVVVVAVDIVFDFNLVSKFDKRFDVIFFFSTSVCVLFCRVFFPPARTESKRHVTRNDTKRAGRDGTREGLEREKYRIENNALKIQANETQESQPWMDGKANLAQNQYQTPAGRTSEGTKTLHGEPTLVVIEKEGELN